MPCHWSIFPSLRSGRRAESTIQSGPRHATQKACAALGITATRFVFLGPFFLSRRSRLGPKGQWNSPSLLVLSHPCRLLSREWLSSAGLDTRIGLQKRVWNTGLAFVRNMISQAGSFPALLRDSRFAAVKYLASALASAGEAPTSGQKHLRIARLTDDV